MMGPSSLIYGRGALDANRGVSILEAHKYNKQKQALTIFRGAKSGQKDIANCRPPQL